MRQVEYFHHGWLWFAVSTLLAGAALFVIGLWCLNSANEPPPSLALPLPSGFLIGMGFMLLNPVTLIPFTVVLTASRFMAVKLGCASAAAVSLVGLMFVLVGALWVPNPVVLWPMDVLGDHTVPELIRELFAFHIVPSPGDSYGIPAGMHSLVRWQMEECGARFCILILGWAACLVMIWTVDRRWARALAKLPSQDHKV